MEWFRIRPRNTGRRPGCLVLCPHAHTPQAGPMTLAGAGSRTRGRAGCTEVGGGGWGCREGGIASAWGTLDGEAGGSSYLNVQQIVQCREGAVELLKGNISRTTAS